jgi:hypothetical protein
MTSTARRAKISTEEEAKWINHCAEKRAKYKQSDNDVTLDTLKPL